MSKLRLNLDQLAVDSFDTAAPPVQKGTVFGEQCTCPTACTCPGCPSCDATCNPNHNTCQDGSCGGTCLDTECGTCYTIDFHTCDMTFQPGICCPP